MTEELREISASTNTIHPTQPEEFPDPPGTPSDEAHKAFAAGLLERLGLSYKLVHAARLLEWRTDEAAQAASDAGPMVPQRKASMPHMVKLMGALLDEVKFLRALHMISLLHTCGDLLPEDVRQELEAVRAKYVEAGLLR